MAQSARFRRVRFGFNTLLFLSAASSAVLMMGGCDTDTGKADKAISQELDAAAIKMAGSPADHQAANTALTTAVRETGDSPMQQLRAKALLGDNEMQLAQDADGQILANDAQIDRLIREISLLGDQIQANNLMVEALAKREPSKVQDSVTQKKADVTGSESKPDWFKSDATSLGSMAADDSQVRDLTAKIADLQNTLKSDADQRNTLLDQADKLTQQSHHEVKQKSVDLYVQGSNARKQAAELTVKIDTNTAMLAQYQADLAVWHGQHDAAAAALKTLDERSTGFDSDWKAAQAMQAQLNKASADILGQEPTDATEPDKTGDLNFKTDQTIGVRAITIGHPIKGLARKNHDLRAMAESHLNNAIGKYAEAVTIAQSLGRSLMEAEGKYESSKPEHEPLDQEKNALDVANYQLLEGQAQLQKAEFFARSAAEAKARLDLIERLKPVLEEAKLSMTTLPSLDDAKTADQLKSAQTESRNAFNAAADLFTQASGGTQVPMLEKAAESQLIFAQYGWSLLEASAGDAQAAATHLGLAKDALGTAKNGGVLLPPLPPELASSSTPTGGNAVPGRTPAKPPAKAPAPR